MLRLPLVALCVLLCAHGLLAGPKALTIKDITLMLRSGYSSEAIISELETRHFAETLDEETEKQWREFPDLIVALKSGEYAASTNEIVELQSAVLRQTEEAKRIARNRIAREKALRQAAIIQAREAKQGLWVNPARTQPGRDR
jgi:predicted ATP-grasp superfamily ATP-dependent carboligase